MQFHAQANKFEIIRLTTGYWWLKLGIKRNESGYIFKKLSSRRETVLSVNGILGNNIDIRQVMARNAGRPVSIAIIGDLCLDLAYQVTTEQAEISVETGLQTYSVLNSKPELGGACNVAVNCKTLGAERVDIYGIVGSDFFGDLLISLLQKHGIETEGVVRQEETWATHVYHKVFERGVEHPRFDSGNFNTPTEASIIGLLSTLKKKLSEYDAVIINEQVPRGLHSESFQKALNEVIESTVSDSGVRWFADCRKLNDIYRKTIHKLNEQEGRLLYGPSCTLDRQELAIWLAKYFKQPIVLTLGPDGAIAVDEKEAIQAFPGIHFAGQIDAVGAGDAFLAGLVVAGAWGANLAEAAYIGNICAGVSLKVLYECGHPSADEVISLSEKADWRYNPEIADDERKALYWKDTPLEIIKPSQMNGFPKVAIFDHDGTISTLRQGWETVMEQSMLTAIAGEAYSSLSSKDIQSLRNDIHAFIDRTTGIQTIEQMHYLVELVRHYGYVPEKEVLTALQYKELYNKDLLAMVDKKVAEIRARRLDATDVTIKGSIDFLRFLSSHGTELYLASGTDVDDVKREAELLGYANYFEGRIFGSVGDVSNDPKRLVIQQIIETRLNGDYESCVVFGDGPVEMREAKRHGLLAVGLLSDEVRRYGLNMKKRSRLVLGGADLLLPDFSHASTLSKYLGWEVK